MRRVSSFRHLMVMLVLPFVLFLHVTEVRADSNLTEVQNHTTSSVADSQGNVLPPDTTDSVAGESSNGHDITIWYGSTQNFGFLGNPQEMINILGNVSDPDGIDSLTYALNGLYLGPLGFGGDGASNPRLVSDGDFNIEINTVHLIDGQNTVVITATDNLTNESIEEVTVNYSAGNSWPEPYGIDWSEVTDITDVAQIVDGEWELESDSIRPTVTGIGYDRTVAIGGIAWDEFEVRVPITIHSFAGSNIGGVGITARWQGHVQGGSEQPAVEWWHMGAYCYYRNRESGTRLRMLWNHYDYKEESRSLSLGVAYYYKVRVQTVWPEQDGLYSFKVWRVGQPEPSTWDLVKQDRTLEDLDYGSVLLVAHQADASFGDVEIVPVVDVEVTTVGNGTVERDPELVDRSDAYLYGNDITLTATADPGWMFMGWSGDLYGTANPATLTLTGDTHITATFAPAYSLTVNVVGDEGGHVVADPPGGSYGEGTVVTLTANVESGWAFADWSGDLSGSANPETITMDSDKTVTATFTYVGYDPALDIVKDGPDAANVGDTVVFTFIVTNDETNGDGSPVSSVSVSDDYAGAATYVSGDDGDGELEVGESWVYTASYTIQPSDPNPLVNTGTVTGKDQEGDDVSANDTHSTGLSGFVPALSIIKDGPDAANVGDTVVFTFTITNDETNGDGSPVSSVSVSDDYAGAATYVSGDDGDGELEVGESWVYTASYTIKPTDPDPLVNIGTVRGEDQESDPVSDTATHSTALGFAPAVHIAKTGPTAANVGDTVVFTFTVTNDTVNGDGSPVSNVSVSDDYAGAATYVSGDDGDGELEVGESWVYAASYTIKPTDPDPLVNTGTVEGEDLGGDPVSDTDTHSTAIREPAPILQPRIFLPIALSNHTL